MQDSLLSGLAAGYTRRNWLNGDYLGTVSGVSAGNTAAARRITMAHC
jgi:hypothetical protein